MDAGDDTKDRITDLEEQADSLDHLIAEAKRLRQEVEHRLRSVRNSRSDSYRGPERRRKPR